MHTTPASRISPRKLSIAIVAFLGMQTTNSLAQALEEIVVTATKREASLQDVPVSVSVMTGDRISEQGAFSLEDITQFIPLVNITETSGNEKLFIRGIGTYGNAGFEQSVGTFVDGVYRGRGQASRAATLDLARVEVLKGPQNTLFGKNTIAGAITVTSADPTSEFEGSLLATAEPEFGGWGTQLVLSGPLTDGLNARLALRADQTDGYFNNRTIGQDERQEDEFVSRLGLEWLASDNLRFLLKWEHGEQDTIGRQNKVGIATPTATFIYQAFGDPNFQAGLDYDKYQDGALPGRPSQFDDSEWDLVSLNTTWNIGDYTLQSITGYIDAQAHNSLDLDFAPVQLIGQQRSEGHKQFTQEFILTSPQGGAVEWLAGFFYQDEELKRFGDLDIFLSGIAPLFAGNPLEPFLQQGFGDATIVRESYQDTETVSAFGQVTWNASHNLRFLAGLRYSKDEKVLDKSLVVDEYLIEGYRTYQGSVSLPNQAFYDQFLGFAKEHSFDGAGFSICDTFFQLPAPVPARTCNVAPGFDNVRKEDHWTGDIVVQYDVNDDAMLYAKWGAGYKAGGYDEANLLGIPEAQEFGDETVKSIEFGAKLGLWDGRARLNIAAFRSEFEDLQVSVFDGVAGFEVRNAAEATSQGIELDGEALLSDALTLYFTMAYLNSEFDSFPGAPCHAGLAASFPGPGPCVADLAGQNTQFAPDFSANLALDYDTAITDSLDLSLGIDVQHSGDYFTTGDNDPTLVQDSFTKINARVELSGAGNWSVALLGKNLTDETIANAPDDIPLGNLGFAGSYFYFLDPPRSYELQATYRF